MNGDSRSKEFLGTGLSFPLGVNSRGEIKTVSGTEDIEQAIRIILGTRPGERVMRPDFGCRVGDLLFEPRNASLETMVQEYVMQALRLWEPRINTQAVNVTSDRNQEGTLLVEISYEVKATHDQRSIVYPFFLVGEEEW
jgi:hypothetical protein